MNTAHQEYERLKQLMSREEGERLVKDTWYQALNFEKNADGEWQKVTDSLGKECMGFAFDKRNPLNYKFSHSGCHSRAKDDLCLQIEKEEKLDPAEVSKIVIEARAVMILDFRLPVIQFWNFVVTDSEDFKNLRELENLVLDSNIGIAANSLLFAKYYRSLENA